MLLKGVKVPATIMTQTSEDNPQMTRRGLHRIRAGIQSQSLQARKRVENITKNDVKGFFLKNSFVIFTVIAVVLGELSVFVHTTLNIYGDLLGPSSARLWQHGKRTKIDANLPGERTEETR